MELRSATSEIRLFGGPPPLDRGFGHKLFREGLVVGILNGQRMVLFLSFRSLILYHRILLTPHDGNVSVSLRGYTHMNDFRVTSTFDWNKILRGPGYDSPSCLAYVDFQR